MKVENQMTNFKFDLSIKMFIKMTDDGVDGFRFGLIQSTNVYLPVNS